MRKLAIPFVVLALCTLGGARPRAATTVFINEFHYDNSGTDTNEFVEIAGPAGTNLAGYSILLYNGSGGAVYDTQNLSGSIPNHMNGFGTVAVSYPVNGIQNGAPDGIALAFNGTLIQFLSYEGAFAGVGGPANGVVSTDIGVIEAGAGPATGSIRLGGTGAVYEDFTWALGTATVGAINQGQTFAGTPSASISINDVSIAEGNAGTSIATFTVSVSGDHPAGVTFDIATADGPGGNAAMAADGDYLQKSLTGQSIGAAVGTYAFTVTINGDAHFEQDEQFVVNLSNVAGAVVADGQGVGTITNDDPVPSDVVISQVYGAGGNNGATYKQDFIELFNRSSSTVSLDGWSVQYQSAGSAGTWQVTTLAGSMAPGTYYLVQESQGTGGTVDLPAPDRTGTILMAAGAAKVALLNTTAAASGNCPAFNNQVDLVGYGAATCFEGGGPVSALSATTAAVRKRGGCFDTNNNNVDFSTSGPTPRNSATPVRSCTFQTVAIHTIQGSGSVTPLLGLDVQTSGIVTGLKTNGFFMQTATDDDSDPATSEGIFVFTQSAPVVQVGDGVTARGTATEFFNLTQLESSLPGDVIVDSTGNAIPSAPTLNASMLDPNGPIVDQLERFEGMRLYAEALVTVGPTNEFGEVQSVLAGVPRPMREPGIEAGLAIPPDPTSGATDCCIPIWDRNPERIMVDTDGLLGSTRLSLTSNVTLRDVRGPLDFTFGAYKILPEVTPLASGNMDAVPVPWPQPWELTVGGYNIENFANGATQRQKAALAIRDVMRLPDVIGHIEIRDLASLEALAQQVNDDAALIGQTPAYVARLIPAPQGGTQHVGFLIKTSRVQIVSVTQMLADQTFFDPVNHDTENLHDRPPLVLRANALLPFRGPQPFIVVVNHLRSFIDVDLVDGEGIRVRAKRKAQAEAVAQLLQDLQTGNPGVPVISVGDYNAYQFNDGYTDPLSVLKGTPTPDDQMVEDASPDVVNPDYVNLMDSLPADQQYSFVFEGTPQALDHVLLNTVAASLNTRFAIARNNADFPDGPLFANDATRPERNSDHDMPVAYFTFPVRADVTVSATGAGAPVLTGTGTSYSIAVANAGPDPATNVVLSIPTVAGLQFSAIFAPAGWICPAVAGGVTCTTASLAPGSSAVITMTAIVACNVSDGAVINQPVMVAADETDDDASNNATSVSVSASNPPPSISGVTSLIVAFPMAGTNPPGAIVSDAQLGAPIVSDNCTATLVRSGVPAGNNFPIGTTTVTYTATDSGGAVATASQVVTVLSSTDSLQAIAADLRDILAAAGQQGPLKARIADALKKVELAIAQLGATPADTQHALISISQASQQIQGLLNQGALPPGVAHSLLQRLAGVSSAIS